MKEQGKISFWSAVLMSINIIIGAGIFFGPKKMAIAAGSMSFLVWPLVVIFIIPIALNLSQASSLFPGEGGFYNYCSKGINKTFGFIGQWAYLIGYIGTAATITTVLRETVVAQTGISFFAAHPYLFNFVIIAFFSALNLLSIEVISKTQSIATLIKLTPIFIGILLLAFYWNPSINYYSSDLWNLGLAAPTALFAFWGFESCCSLGHLLKGGPQQVGKVVIMAFFIAAALYMLFHFSLMNIMGVQGLCANDAISFPQFMGLSPALVKILSLIIAGSIILSFCNTIFGISLTNITNIFILADQKLILGGDLLTRTNSLHRPTFTALIHGIIVWLLLVFIPHMDVLAALTNIGVIIAFALTMVAVYLTQRRKKNVAQQVLSILSLLSCALLFYLSWVSISPVLWYRILYVLPVFVAIGAGFAMYKIQQSK